METKAFAELGLSPKVLAAVEASGYTIATPIQSAAIPIAISGRDVLGIAQTGTGKTAAFTLPMITRLESGRARARMPRSLILAPTRELAAQVAQAFEKYGINHKLDVALLIGGVSMDEQVKKLDRGVDVLIATPGRLLDHFGRGRIMLMGVEILVIDEADRMLDMGFIPDIEKICKLLPPRRQTLFFSATMPAEITRLVDQFLKDPVRVEVAKPATTAKTITQRFRLCRDGEDFAKREALRDLMRVEDVRNAIIFCNRKRDVAILLKSLLKHGFNAGALHGDMEQSARTATLDKFRSGELTFLAASDVAARGLDIPDVSHIFNYDLPWQADDYVHRIGRTGRAGKLGYSASLVTFDDLKLLKDIEKITGEAPVWLGDEPTEEDVASAGKRRRGRGGDARSTSGGDARRTSGGDARKSGGGRGSDARTASSAAPKPGVPDAHQQGGGERGAERSADRGARPPRAEGEAQRGDRPPRHERSRRPERGEGLRHLSPEGSEIGAPLLDQPRTEELAPPAVELASERAVEARQPDRDGGRDRPRRDGGTPRAPRESHAPRTHAESREPIEAREHREPREGGREQREPRDNREPRARRDERQPREQREQPREQPREQREQPREPRGERREVRDHRDERPQREQAPRQSGGERQGSDRQGGGRAKPAGSAPGGAGGFADNVPAFLRKPPRPLKVAGE
ncbi:MAG: DEAD/DEAH box helicase [Hyphomicrobium sp.]